MNDATKTKKQRLRETRKAARADMRNHPTFLGGTNQVGAAFSLSNWKHKPACYTCDSVMGYTDPMGETDDEARADISEKHC
jgi:hypothetical protein